MSGHSPTHIHPHSLTPLNAHTQHVHLPTRFTGPAVRPLQRHLQGAGKGPLHWLPNIPQGRRPGLGEFQSLRPADSALLSLAAGSRAGDAAHRPAWGRHSFLSLPGGPGTHLLLAEPAWGGSDTWSRKPGTGPYGIHACHAGNSSHALLSATGHIPIEGHSLLTITFHRHS